VCTGWGWGQRKRRVIGATESILAHVFDRCGQGDALHPGRYHHIGSTGGEAGDADAVVVDGLAAERHVSIGKLEALSRHAHCHSCQENEN